MKDNEIRGLVLQQFYDHRSEPEFFPKRGDFGEVNLDTIYRICGQLNEYNLIEWEPLIGPGGITLEGFGRITASGVDVIEKSVQPPIAIIVHNHAITVGSAVNSPIQQSIDSNSQQTTTYNLPSNDDLKRLIKLLDDHLPELKLTTSDEKKAKAQLATMEAQLLDEPNPLIVKEAAKTLRNVIEGAIGSLVASAMQPTVWTTIRSLLTSVSS